MKSQTASGLRIAIREEGKVTSGRRVGRTSWQKGAYLFDYLDGAAPDRLTGECLPPLRATHRVAAAAAAAAGRARRAER